MVLSIGDFFAGWAGGVVSLLVSYPLDTVKVRQQAYHINLLTAIKETYKYEGISGYYRGIISPLLTYGPSNSIFFGVYGNCMRLLEHQDTIDHHISPSDIAAIHRVFIAGTVAGLIQTIVYSPVEHVKTVLQANFHSEICGKNCHIPRYENTSAAVRDIYKISGLLGFYRGFWPTLVRDGPSGGIYMLLYEMLRHSTLERVHSLSDIWKEVIAGGTAGVVSITTVIPFDVVKTHMQTDDPRKPRFRGMIDCFRKLYASDGIKIFFKGVPIICYRAFPAHAIMFVGYEFVMQLLK